MFMPPAIIASLEAKAIPAVIVRKAWMNNPTIPLILHLEEKLPKLTYEHYMSLRTSNLCSKYAMIT